MSIVSNNIVSAAKKSVSVESTNNLAEKSNNLSNSIMSATDAPTNYSASKAPTDAELQQFLAAFAKNNHVYGLINTLNNTLKGIFREAREDEARFRINQYIKQFDIALDKRDETIKAADEIYKVKMEAADFKKVMGIATAVIGGVGIKSGLFSGLTQIGEARLDTLNAQADDLKMRLDAKTTELDANQNLARQEGELSGAFISLLDSLNSTFSSLINDLHASHSGTVNSMGKGMV